MYYRQKKDTYIRNYDGVGYITSSGLFNDRLVNSSGAVFLQALSRKPQSTEQLLEKICPQFIGVEKTILRKDAIEFFDILVEDGFLVKGTTVEELDRQDTGFSYKMIDPIASSKTDYSPKVKRAGLDTQTELEKLFAKKPHLTSFQIELTSKCNERCIHCYIPHDFKLHDIKPGLFFNVLEQLRKMGVLSLTLSGGEPMLHPNFSSFLRAAKSFDFNVCILSNLTLLNDEIVAAMKEGNAASVQVSLYSMIPEHHDAITTVKGSFEKTKKAILTLIDNDIPLHVSCPVMKANKNDYLDVMKWCHEHKVRSQTDYIMMAEFNHDTSNLANRLSVDEVGNVIRSILLEDIDYQKAILSADFIENCNKACFDPERRLCGVGSSSCCMVANGNVYPCPGWQEYVLGNLNNDSLENIWNNSDKIKYLRSLRMKDLGNGKCCNCEFASFCSPCMVRNANESYSGNPLEINSHFCAVAAKNKQVVLDWRNEHLGKIN